MFPKIKYNPQNNILSLRFSKNKSVDSEIHGNVVMDFDKDGNTVNIDIMKFNIEGMLNRKSTKINPVKWQKKIRSEWV